MGVVSSVNNSRISDRRNQIFRVFALIGFQSVATAIATIFIRIIVVNNSSDRELKFYPTFMVLLTLASVASFSVQERVVKTYSGSTEWIRDVRHFRHKVGDRLIWLLVLGFWVVLMSYQEAMSSLLGVVGISASLVVTNYLFASAQGHSLRNSDFRAYTGFPVLVVALQGISAVVLLRLLHLSLFWFILTAAFTPLAVFLARSRCNYNLRGVSPFILLSDKRIWKSAASLLLVWLLVQWDQIYIPNCSADALAQDYVRFSTFSRVPLFVAAAVAPYVLKLNPARKVARFKETNLFYTCISVLLFCASVVLILSHEVWFPLMFGQSVSLGLMELFVLGFIHPLAGIALILSFRDLNSGTTVATLAASNLPMVLGVTVGCGRLSGGSALFDGAIVGVPLLVAVGLLIGRQVFSTRMIEGVQREGNLTRE